MKHRSLLSLTVAAVVCSASLASAAPKARAACNLVVDARGDQQVATANHYPVKGEPWSSDYDLLSADVATNRTHITAVIRLASLRTPAQDATSPSQRYSLEFTAGSERFEMAAFLGVDGESGYAYHSTGFTGDENSVGAGTAEGIGYLKVELDEDNAVIRMTGPLSIFQPYTSMSPGHALSAFRAWSFQFEGKAGKTVLYPVPEVPYGAVIGGGGASHSTDRAESKATYRTGSRSCVVVGK
jgi:hypothetical protein